MSTSANKIRSLAKDFAKSKKFNENPASFLKRYGLMEYLKFKRRYKKPVTKVPDIPIARPCKKVLNGLFNTNDLKGCAMFGADTWNELKATVSGFAADVLDGKYYVVPTIISCPARGSGDSLTDELFGFNDDYAAMLGAKWYEKAWSGIKNFTKNTTHMALSAGAVIPITKPFVSAIRSVNDAGKNLLQQFGIIKKSSSDDAAPAGVVTGGGLLILAGVGVGAYFLLKDDKKNKRG